MTTFRDDQIRRYSRQILLKEIGGRGQRRLLEANIRIVGLGPVGAACACYLAAAGAGALTLEDPRPVTQEDIGAGGLYNADDLGSPRHLIAARALHAQNPDVSFPETAPKDALLILCGDTTGLFGAPRVEPGGGPTRSGHVVGLQAGVAGQRAKLSRGCLSCASLGFSEGEGILRAALSLAAGTFAAYEAVRGILGQRSPLHERHAWLDLGEMRYGIESVPCSLAGVED